MWSSPVLRLVALLGAGDVVGDFFVISCDKEQAAHRSHSRPRQLTGTHCKVCTAKGTRSRLQHKDNREQSREIPACLLLQQQLSEVR